MSQPLYYLDMVMNKTDPQEEGCIVKNDIKQIISNNWIYYFKYTKSFRELLDRDRLKVSTNTSLYAFWTLHFCQSVPAIPTQGLWGLSDEMQKKWVREGHGRTCTECSGTEVW